MHKTLLKSWRLQRSSRPGYRSGDCLVWVVQGQLMLSRKHSGVSSCAGYIVYNCDIPVFKCFKDCSENVFFMIQRTIMKMHSKTRALETLSLSSIVTATEVKMGAWCLEQRRAVAALKTS